MQKKKPLHRMPRHNDVKSYAPEAMAKPPRYEGFFNFAKLPDRRKYEIYRMWKNGCSPEWIARKFGYHEGAFCEQWQQTMLAMIRIYEEPVITYNNRPAKDGVAQFNRRELNLIKMAVVAGRTHDEIAKLLDVTSDTLREYRKKNPLIDEYMKNGYEEELLKVEAAIQRRAQGMITYEDKLASYMGQFLDTRRVKVTHLPDPRSAELVLVNKRKWMSANVGGPDQTSEKGKILEFIDQAASDDEEQPTESQAT